jgi:hypothetical protein
MMQHLIINRDHTPYYDVRIENAIVDLLQSGRCPPEFTYTFIVASNDTHNMNIKPDIKFLSVQVSVYSIHGEMALRETVN